MAKNQRPSSGRSKTDEPATPITKEFLVGTLNYFRSEVFAELKNHSSQFQEFKLSLEFLYNKLDVTSKAKEEIKHQNKLITSENAELKKNNVSLTQKIFDQEITIRDLEKYSRFENVEINGLPASPNEDVMALLRDVRRTIGVELRGDWRGGSSLSADIQQDTSIVIIVRFTTRNQRDAWI